MKIIENYIHGKKVSISKIFLAVENPSTGEELSKVVLSDLSDFKMNNDNSVVFNKYKSRKSGYNTYINKGLPIGPICNPGLSALLSAIKPDKTDFYFFIADDKGKTYFSKTKREHNNKINEFFISF